MESFSVSTEFTPQDWSAYRRASLAESRNYVGARWQVLIAAIFATITFAVLSLDVSSGSFAIGMIAAVVAFVVFSRLNFKAVEPRQRRVFLGGCRYEFGPEGIRSSRDGVESTIKWSRIRQRTEDTDHVYLWLEQPAAFVVPVRDLPPGVSRDEAIARFDAWKAQSNESASVSDPQAIADQSLLGRESFTPSAQPKDVNLFTTLWRLFTLRASNGAAITGSDRSIVGLIVLTMGLWVIIDRLRAGANVEFSIYNLPNLGLIAIALLGLSYVLARWSRPFAEFRRVLALVLAFLPVAMIASALMSEYLSDRWQLIGLILLAAYAAVYSMRALSAITGRRQVAATLAGLILFFAFWVFSVSSLDLDAGVWYEAKASTDSADDWKVARGRAEALLYEQLDRIDDAIDAIPPPVDKMPGFFFVGFAGVGEQKVFAEEIKLASTVVDKRYNTGKRSLLLMNDRRDLDSYPLATTTGLHYALGQLAAKMDPDDILFLALSSHGSADPELSVSNIALPLNDMSGEELASALDESGIKWRVIVISACHAGAFIKYLKNPNTIIITAAAADRSSFGCADDRDLTYFGEAFYRDALPNSKSLLEAFNEAKVAIAKREKEEGQTPSNPQAFFGEEMKRRLDGR